jgi:hypothetical protein
MKKRFWIAVATVFGLVSFVSCKKENPAPSHSVVGFWKGKLGQDQQYPIHGYAYLFRSNGTVRVYFLGNNPDTLIAKIAEGTYLITGNQVNTTHTYFSNGPQHSTVGTINANYSFTEGSWINVQYPNLKGKFFLNKQ